MNEIGKNNFLLRRLNIYCFSERTYICLHSLCHLSFPCPLFFLPSFFFFSLRYSIVRHSFHHEVRAHRSITGCICTVGRCSFYDQHKSRRLYYDCHSYLIRHCNVDYHEHCRDHLRRYDLCSRKHSAKGTDVVILYRERLVIFRNLLAATLFRSTCRRYHYPSLRQYRRTQSSSEHLLCIEQSTSIFVCGHQCHLCWACCAILSRQWRCDCCFYDCYEQSNSTVYDQSL
jgi:hypothetical protein